MKRFILLLFFTTVGVCYSQPKNKLDRSKSIQDGIDLSLNEFSSGKHEEANKIIKQILHEGYRKKDTTTIGRSYRYLLHYSLEKNPNKQYADSLRKYIYKIDNEYYPSVGLFVIGCYYYESGDEVTALNYFIKSKNAVNKSNTDTEYIDRAIRAIKMNWSDDYKNSISLIKMEIDNLYPIECKSETCFDYHLRLLNTYCDSRDTTMVTRTTKEIIEKLKVSNLNEQDSNVISLKVSAIKDFYFGNYLNSIGNFERLEMHETKDKDFHTINNYYLGLSYLKLQNSTKAVLYFEKADSLSSAKNYINPKLSGIYPVLIEHYSNIDLKKQLKYVNRYIEVTDRINELRSKINLKILNEFDKPLLLSQRKKLEDRIALQKQIRTWVLIGAICSIIALLTILVIYRKQGQKSKKKMFAVIATLRKNQKESVDRTTDVFKMENESRFIADEISQGILIRLKKWEQEGGFLDQTVNQVDLARTLETNTSYLSKVINCHWNLNFSQYLNHLRIRYIVKELERNKQLQKYTVAALATESGFTNAKSFSKSFKEIMGFNPSSYVQELQGLKS